MINRRELAALFAAMPIAAGPHRLNRLDLPDLRINPVDTGDVQVISISPDGGTLAGIRDRKQMVFIKIETREEISTSEDIPEIQSIEIRSLTWSPDGRHVAFSLDAWRLAIDSDIFIVEVESGKVTNLTAEGHEDEAASLMISGEAKVDIYPSWIENETLLFARHTWSESGGDELNPTLVTQTLDATDARTLVERLPQEVATVMGPVIRLADERVVLGTTTLKGQGLICVVQPGGTVDVVSDPDSPTALVDADETGYIATDPRTGRLWLGSYDDPANQTDIRDLFEIEPDIALAALPVFGREPGSMAVLRADINQTLLKREEGTTKEVAYLNEAEVQAASIHWVQDRFLVTSRHASWLTDRES